MLCFFAAYFLFHEFKIGGHRKTVSNPIKYYRYYGTID
jgi:hypothetical protein